MVVTQRRARASRSARKDSPEFDWVSLLGSTRTVEYAKIRRSYEEENPLQQVGKSVGASVKKEAQAEINNVKKAVEDKAKAAVGSLWEQMKKALPKSLIGCFAAGTGAGAAASHVHEERPLAAAKRGAEKMPGRARAAAEAVHKRVRGEAPDGEKASASIHEDSDADDDPDKEVPTPKNTIVTSFAAMVTSFLSIFSSDVDFAGAIFSGSKAPPPPALVSVEPYQPPTGELGILWTIVVVLLVVAFLVSMSFGFGWMLAMRQTRRTHLPNSPKKKRPPMPVHLEPLV